MKKTLKKFWKKKTIVVGMLALLMLAVVGFFFVYLKYGFIGADVSPIKANLTLSGGGQKTLGSNFDVMVNLNPNGNRVCVVDLSLTYPASILTLNAAPTLVSPFSLATITDSGTPGQIHYQIGATGCTTGSGGILKLNFKAQKTGQGTLSFTQTSLLGGNDGQLEILATTSGANVSVVSTGSTPTPTPTPNPTDTPTPPPTEEPTPTGEPTPTEAPPPTEGQTPAPPVQTTNLPQSSPGRSPAPTLSSRTGLPAPQQQTSAQPTTTKKSKYITWLLVILGLVIAFEVIFILIKRRKEKV